MAYRMTRVSTTGPRGLASCKTGKKNGKTFVRVTFEDDNKSYDIRKTSDNVPEYYLDGKFVVKLSPDKSKIDSMSPYSGQFEGMVKEFVHRENELPAPQTNTKAKWPYEYFAVLIEITSPEKYAGMVVYIQLHYRFEPADFEWKGKQVEIAAIPISKARSVEMLDNFIMATKAVAKGPIPYSDNILPYLQKRIMRESAKFTFTMKDGWIDHILPPDMNEDGGEDDWGDKAEEAEPEPEKAPKKKSTKKEKEPEPQLEGDGGEWGDEPEEETDGFADGADFDDEKEEAGDEVEAAPWDEVED